MAELKENQKFEQVVQKFYPQSRLRRAWKLEGGVSAQVTALEIEHPDGALQKMIVRLHGAADLKSNPNIAADEFKLLQILQAAGIAAPKPYRLDPSGQIFPTPYLIIEFIEGKSDFAPANLNDFLFQMAVHLAKIHAVDCSQFELSFLPEQEKIYTEKISVRPVQLDESIGEGQIRDILEGAWPLPRPNKAGLLHGDYWPGNLLWQDSQLAAIIDWEDAKLGDPLADLGITRLEIMWAFGSEAMDLFTGHYKSMATLDFANLPYWDLCAALRPAFKIAEWAGDAAAEAKMLHGHQLFITQAFEKLPVN
jgi:aminoglycoside phosphotransferase (APT) family kinase protein